jgi:predicted transcriptional regulator of viral defense system
MDEQSAKGRDIALARLAAAQEAMASTAQMHELGLSRQAIYVRQRRGGLHRVHHGVYLVGVPRVTPRGRLWAAALACGGPDAAWISHLSAAAEWRLLEHVPRRVDVITTTGSRSTDAIRVHRPRSLDAQRDVTRRHGLPITTPSRILMDIAARAPTHVLQTACHEAAFRGHLDHGDIALRLGPDPPGAAKLRKAIEHLAKTGPRRTKSRLEQDFSPSSTATTSHRPS